MGLCTPLLTVTYLEESPDPCSRSASQPLCTCPTPGKTRSRHLCLPIRVAQDGIACNTKVKTAPSRLRANNNRRDKASTTIRQDLALASSTHTCCSACLTNGKTAPSRLRANTISIDKAFNEGMGWDMISDHDCPEIPYVVDKTLHRLRVFS